MANLSLKLIQGELIPEKREHLVYTEYMITLKKGDVLTIGRGSKADIRVKDEKVSREHCAFVRKNGKWSLIDNNSTSGTFIIRKDKFFAELFKGGEFNCLEWGDILSLGGMEKGSTRFQILIG
ncbi:FHA domain-containing protein [Candidatus Woesearchaeota archaeon]|nr:FHA domain-containing protein [Candidatus Woesearchaeota archaeon]MBW3005463.1 FHA domain-containing protein [Candidatus Woesearchaeota archaeon]